MLGRGLMIVNNYPGTGIGDFGLELHKNLERQEVHSVLQRTPTSWAGFVGYFFSTLAFDGRIIYNLGLTAWGRSGLRNFLGFLSIRLRRKVGRGDIVILHNVIEAIDLKSAGYHLSSTARRGAHFAIGQLRKMPIVVFSRSMEELLVRFYGIVPGLWHPLPVDNFAPTGESLKEVPLVLMVGYLAPYKGYEFLLDAAETIDYPIKILIVGDEHRILRSDPEYQAFLQRVRSRAQTQGIECIPRIPSEALPGLMAAVDLGVLPYVASQGACASASLLISHHVPMLATDLPEFRELARLGCGIVLSTHEAREFAKLMKEVIGNPELLRTLRAKQRHYAEVYSWDNFVERLKEFLCNSQREAEFQAPVNGPRGSH